MKLFSVLVALLFTANVALAQKDFAKYTANAKAAMAKPDLEDTRYNLMLSLQQLDLKVGQEILKQMPEQLGNLPAQKSKDDVVAVSAGFIGTTIHREYGTEIEDQIVLDIVSNSPLVGALNSWLSNPMMAQMGGRKPMKVDGFKGSYTYAVNETTDAKGQVKKIPRSEMQIPVYASLVTITANHMSEDDFVKMLNTLPISKMAEMVK